ncbi:DNRLRE domain-containing protein [Candidatus Peregrinibacteria bacterium]|nr:MAG: DNRLRE domain-containing protein [Candidatus Peregrinibacteria bacterium]
MNGTEVYVGEAIVFDQSEKNSAIQNVPYQFREQNGVLELGIELTSEYLQDPDRVYPVVIDPTYFYCYQSTNSYCTSVTDLRLVSLQDPVFFPSGFETRYTDSYLIAGYDMAQNTAHTSIVKFNTNWSNIPANSQIDSAFLHLMLDDQPIPSTYGSSSLRAFQIGTSWNQSTVTYSQLSGNLTPLGGRTITGTSVDTPVNFDVTDAVRSWVAGTSSNNGFLLKPLLSWTPWSTNPWPNYVFRFYSSRYGSGSDYQKWPYLEVNYSTVGQPNLTDNGLTLNTNLPARPGDPLVGSIGIINNGSASAPAGQLYLYLEKGGINWNVGNRIQTISYGSLAAGASQNLSFNYSLPYNAAEGNDYELYWTIDATNTANESNESDNGWRRPSPLNIVAQANARFSDVNASVNGGASQATNSSQVINVAPGSTINFTFRGVNNGISNVGRGDLDVFSNSGSLPVYSIANRVQHNTYSFMTSGGGLSDFEVPYNYTAPTTTGNYAIGFWIDAGAETTETNEFDNYHYVVINVQGASGPDVTGIQGYLNNNQTIVSPGETVSGVVRVRNVGNAIAPAGVIDLYFKQAPEVFDVQYRMQRINYGSLPVSSNLIELPFTFTVPQSAPSASDYKLDWRVDATNTANEIGNGEQNNDWVSPANYQVTPGADLNISQASYYLNNNSGNPIPLNQWGTVSAQENDVINLSFTVANTGASASGPSTIESWRNSGLFANTGQTSQQSWALAGLQPGATATFTSQFLANGTGHVALGQNAIVVRVDSQNQVSESNEGNNNLNLDLAISSATAADLATSAASYLSAGVQNPYNTISFQMDVSNLSNVTVNGIVSGIDFIDSVNGGQYPLANITPTSINLAPNSTVTRTFTATIPGDVDLYRTYQIRGSIFAPPGFFDANFANNSTTATGTVYIEPQGYSGTPNGGNPGYNPRNGCTIRGLVDSECDGFADLEEKAGGTNPGPSANPQTMQLFDLNQRNYLSQFNDIQMGSHGADPVNLRTGAFEFHQVDFELPGRGVSIKFERTYNSALPDFINRMGNGWNFSYNTYAFKDPHSGDVMVNFGGNLGVLFTYDANTQTYQAPEGVTATLTENTANNSYIYRTLDAVEYRFNRVLSSSMAMLEEIVDRNGNTTTLNYTLTRDIPLLTSVSDASGRQIQLTYGDINSTEWDKIISLTEAINPVTSERRTVNYTYDANGDLVTVTSNRAYQGTVETFTRSFTYDANHRMLTYTDKRGTVLINRYDTQGRVISQSETNPVAGTVDQRVYYIAYGGASLEVPGSTKCTTVTAPRAMGLTYDDIYCYNANEQLIYKRDGLGFPILYTYDPDGLVQTITDRNGNITSFGYDSLRRKVSEVLPNITGNHAGIGNNVSLQTTHTYVYENTFNQLINKTITVADSTGAIATTDQKVWQYTINPTTGNLDSQTDPRGNSESYTYDAFGNVLTHTDRRGNVVTYGYDANGNYLASTSIQVTNARGATDTINENFQHDVYGNLTQKTDDRGNTTTWSYDTEGNLRLQTDALTNTRAYTYDEEGNRLTETNERGYVTRYVWDGNMEYETKPGANLLIVIKEGDPNDATDDITVNYTYDLAGNKISETHPEMGANFITTYAYDSVHQLLQIQDPIGTLSSVYDANGNLIQEAGIKTMVQIYNARNQLTEKREFPSTVLTLVEQLIYDGFGRVVERVDASGNTSSYAYDANDNLTLYTDGEGNSTTYTYDANNNRTSVLLPRAQSVTSDRNTNGASTNYEYDELNRAIREVNAINLESLTFYDGNGNVVEFVDRQTNATTNNTHVSTYQYDALNQRTRETDANGNSVVRTYDPAGNVLTERDRENNTTTYTYDAFNRVITQRDAANLGEDYTYDKAGNIVRKVLADGTDVDYQYDGRNRNTVIQDQNGTQKTYVYDSKNNLTEKNDGIENWVYLYDNINRLLSENGLAINFDTTQVPVGVDYTYDNNGNKTSAFRSFNTASYNANNQQTSIGYANGHTSTYTYDANGNLSSELTGNNEQIDYSYDALNRLVTKQFGNQRVDYTYDNWGNVLNVNHDTHRATYTYDALNQPLTELQQFDAIDWESGLNINTGPSVNISHQYNNNGQLTQRTDALGRVFDYTYDNRNLLNTVALGTTVLADYDYSPVGKVSQITYGNGVVQTHGFDSVNRINNLTIQSGTTQLRRQQYQYTVNHNRSQLIDQVAGNTTRTIDYVYNTVGQLQLIQDSGIPGGAGFGGADKIYQYDNTGNRFQSNGFNNSYNLYVHINNELIQSLIEDGRVVIDYTYDGNGSLTREDYRRLDTNVRSIDYTYDPEGNLRSIQNTWYQENPYGTSFTQQAVRYLYDHKGNRTVKLQSIDRQSGINLTFYVNDGNRVINELVSNSSNITPFISSKSIVYGIDQIAQIDANGVIEYVHTDPIGSTLVMTDASGNDIKQMEYAPFGEVMGASGPGDTKYQFTGQEYDPESELVYMNARYYSPSLGRFIQKDPVIGYEGNALSWNPYVYANNNPLRYNDPTGMDGEEISLVSEPYLPLEFSNSTPYLIPFEEIPIYLHRIESAEYAAYNLLLTAGSGIELFEKVALTIGTAPLMPDAAINIIMAGLGDADDAVVHFANAIHNTENALRGRPAGNIVEESMIREEFRNTVGDTDLIDASQNAYGIASLMFRVGTKSQGIIDAYQIKAKTSMPKLKNELSNYINKNATSIELDLFEKALPEGAGSVFSFIRKAIEEF